jgi:hypothetical protein
VDHSITPDASTTSAIPEAWELAARKAGEQAAMSVRFEYEATMKARADERASNQPAYWLDSHPCPAWCARPGSHRSGDDPSDRVHESDTLAVTLDTMPPSVAYAEYAAPEVTFGLTMTYREVEARVYMTKDGDEVLHATLDEAEQAAFVLLDLVRRARGLAAPVGMPFDPDGRCSDKSCRHCYGQSAVSA